MDTKFNENVSNVIENVPNKCDLSLFANESELPTLHCSDSTQDGENHKNKTIDKENHMAFISERNFDSSDTDETNEELNIKICSVIKKEQNEHENNSSTSHNISDVAENNQQTKKIKHHRRSVVYSRKRKLNSHKKKESDELEEKRSRRESQLKRRSENSSPDKIENNRFNRSHSSNDSTKVDHTNVANYEYEVEDSKLKIETEAETNSDEIKGQNKLTKEQIAHNDKILELLNQATPERLRSLSRIGPKTAMMIHQYIKLNGKLKSLKDLEKMSGWSPKFLDQFLRANLIILD